MTRTKATAPYWVQPRISANPNESPRRSSRLRKDDASKTEPTIPPDPQSSSPLFKLPPEIRNHIFKLALTTYEDLAKPCNTEIRVRGCYQTKFPHHRPGHYHHRRTDTALLRTCRLIHDETALLPVSINTHTLCYPNIHVLSFPMSTVATSYFKCMTSAQLAAVQHMHIFAGRSRLTARDPGQYISHSAFAELGFLRGKRGERVNKKETICGIGAPYPKTMTITIRFCECSWQNRPRFDLDNMLRNRHWENVFGGLKELRIELEIEDAYRENLVSVIDKLKVSEFDVGGGEWLVAEEYVKESGWTGPIQRPVPCPQEDKWEETRYYVATMVWKMRSDGQVSKDQIPVSALCCSFASSNRPQSLKDFWWKNLATLFQAAEAPNCADVFRVEPSVSIFRSPKAMWTGQWNGMSSVSIPS